MCEVGVSCVRGGCVTSVRWLCHVYEVGVSCVQGGCVMCARWVCHNCEVYPSIYYL